MNIPRFQPNSKDKLQKIIDKHELVYSSNESEQKSTIGEKFDVNFNKIKASYNQFLREKQLFTADSIHVEVLKPAEASDSHYEQWKFADVKKIKIRQLKTKINQVLPKKIKFYYYGKFRE